MSRVLVKTTFNPHRHEYSFIPDPHPLFNYLTCKQVRGAFLCRWHVLAHTRKRTREEGLALYLAEGDSSVFGLSSCTECNLLLSRVSSVSFTSVLICQGTIMYVCVCVFACLPAQQKATKHKLILSGNQCFNDFFNDFCCSKWWTMNEI